MDNITITLQEFLDGSLNAEDEAELLHRLSVSPERRELLRSFMKQQAIIASDRAAITVPYSAEQKLWAALAEMPPLAGPIATEAPIAATNVIITSSPLMKIAATALVAVVLGFVAGYYFNSKQDTTKFATASEHSLGSNNFPTNAGSTNIISNGAATPVSAAANAISNSSERNVSHLTRALPAGSSVRPLSEAPLSHLNSTNNTTDIPAPISNTLSIHSSIHTDILATIPEAYPYSPAVVMVRDPNEVSNRSPIWNPDGTFHHKEASVLDRLEFSTNVGLGKEFPNSAATNISIPIITNGQIAVKYMIVPELWVGGGFGYANVNQKRLFTTAVAPSDPTSYEQVNYDYVHESTAWVGGLLEYRLPVSQQIELALNGGIAASGLGAIYSSELGVRYELSSNYGVLAGARVIRITSNVAKQNLDIINSGSTGLAYQPGTRDETPNYNLEFSTGIYFRF